MTTKHINQLKALRDELRNDPARETILNEIISDAESTSLIKESMSNVMIILIIGMLFVPMWFSSR